MKCLFHDMSTGVNESFHKDKFVSGLGGGTTSKTENPEREV